MGSHFGVGEFTAHFRLPILVVGLGCSQGVRPLTWQLTGGPFKRKFKFQVPPHRCHVSWKGMEIAMPHASYGSYSRLDRKLASVQVGRCVQRAVGLQALHRLPGLH